jgi:hypothetical protein
MTVSTSFGAFRSSLWLSKFALVSTLQGYAHSIIRNLTLYKCAQRFSSTNYTFPATSTRLDTGDGIVSPLPLSSNLQNQLAFSINNTSAQVLTSYSPSSATP